MSLIIGTGNVSGHRYKYLPSFLGLLVLLTAK